MGGEVRVSVDQERRGLIHANYPWFWGAHSRSGDLARRMSDRSRGHDWIDPSWRDPEWVGYLGDLGQRAATEGLDARLFPVAMEPGVLDDLGLDEQAIRRDEWDSATESLEQRLMRELAYEFARMLRRHLHLLRLPHGDEHQLEQHLQKIQTFLSYSKHDGHGKDVAEAIRCWLYQNSALSSFLDVYDIPAGLPFPDVIHHHIGKSIFLAIHTDSYSSREWCRREVIEAKRKGMPMIVVDCLNTGDERAFPYLGNVPVVRMDPVAKDRLPEIAGRLLDEVLVDFLWSCRVEVLPEQRPGTVFMARPPELVSLATLAVEQDIRRVVVYPDPPLRQRRTAPLGRDLGRSTVPDHDPMQPVRRSRHDPDRAAGAGDGCHFDIGQPGHGGP